MQRVKVSSKGQVTIPKAVREKLGLRPGDKVDFYEKNGWFYLRKDVPGESSENASQTDAANKENPFSKWKGCLTHLKGRDVDELIEEMRGR